MPRSGQLKATVRTEPASERHPAREWTLISNHGAVLLCLAENPDIRMRDVADRVGITERATQRIIADLSDRGYVSRIRNGRRNSYVIHPEAPMRTSGLEDHTVGELLELVASHQPTP